VDLELIFLRKFKSCPCHLKLQSHVTWDQPPNPHDDRETMPAVTSAISRFSHSSNILILQKTSDAQKGQVDVKTIWSTKVARGLGPQFSPPIHPLHTMTHTRTLGQKHLAKRSRKCHPKVIFQAPKYVLSMELDQNRWALHQKLIS